MEIKNGAEGLESGRENQSKGSGCVIGTIPVYGEGTGSPFQYSSRRIPWDRGA